MRKNAKRAVMAILLVAFVGGATRFTSLAVELRDKRREWREIQSQRSVPLPPPGFIHVRCDRGDRPNHWIVTIRCRESYRAFFHHNYAGFHPSEMKFFDDLHNMERVQLGLETTRKSGMTLAGYQEAKVRWLNETLDEWLER